MLEATPALVRFYQRALPNVKRTESEGAPAYDKFDFVEIRAPGQDKQVVDRKVKDKDKIAYKRQWELYELGMSDQSEGLPISQWPGVDVSEVAMLSSLNVFTVQQLASLDDAAIAALGRGGRELVRRAQFYLDQAPKVADANLHAAKERLTKENQRLQTEIGVLQHTIRDRDAEIAGLKGARAAAPAGDAAETPQSAAPAAPAEQVASPPPVPAPAEEQTSNVTVLLESILAKVNEQGSRIDAIEAGPSVLAKKHKGKGKGGKRYMSPEAREAFGKKMKAARTAAKAARDAE